MDGRSIVYQNKVADIVPASRHGSDVDVATVTSTILFAESPDQDAIQGSGGQPVGRDGRLVTVTRQVEVPSEGEVFSLRLTIPDKDAGALVKNGAFSLVVLLPRDSVYEGEPIYEVELHDYTKEPVPRVFGVFDLPSLGNRIGLAWYQRQDPESVTEYVYRRISGHS